MSHNGNIQLKEGLVPHYSITIVHHIRSHYYLCTGQLHEPGVTLHLEQPRSTQGEVLHLAHIPRPPSEPGQPPQKEDCSRCYLRGLLPLRRNCIPHPIPL